MNKTRVPLYERLPEIYRIKDAEQHPPDQLKSFLSSVEKAFGAIHDNIENLYHDLFIETCDDWAIPYIADLLGVSHLKGDPWTLRADAADAIALRRRKGTLAGIERLVRDLTQWGVHRVELRENLAWSQHLNHQRPDRGGAPAYGPGIDIPLNRIEDYERASGKRVRIVTDAPVDGRTFHFGWVKRVTGAIITIQTGKTERDIDFHNISRAKEVILSPHTVVRGGLAPLRDPSTLSFVGSPFDAFAHTPDLKPPAPNRIRCNLPNLAIFLWRLKPYRIEVSAPASAGAHSAPPSVDFTTFPAAATHIARFHVHPLARPIRLFNHPCSRL